MKQAVRPLLLLLLAAVSIGRSPASGAGAIAAIRVVPPVSSVKILPTGEVTAGRVSDEIGVVACRGEYEPASFVVTAAARIDSLGVQVADLTGPGGTIPAAQIDVKVVKCWYQSSSVGEAADKELDKRALTPALLLNDDTLVKVDYETRDNYLKSPLPGEESYIRVSNPNEQQGDNPAIPSDAFPFKDSPVLLPVSLDANSNKQFWLTVHVPEHAEAGNYSGRITLSGQAEPVYLTLRLRVLPFELLKPYYTSSMYYNNQYGHQVLLRYRKEMENLIAHGVSNPIFYPAGPEWDDQFLQIRKDLGLAGQPLITIQNPVDPSPAEIAAYIAWARSYGFTDVYFTGIDEAHTDTLVWELPRWQRSREAGAKIFASGAQEAGSTETYGRPDSYFQTVGNLLDIFNNCRWPTREQAALWHSRGQKIWSYANPHVGQDDPEVYRRNYGLLLWRATYDGIGIYAYQHHSGNSYNDFDGGMRELNLAYPTSDGVIDTIVWEGYREGVDDVRYVTTLERAIADAKARGSEPQRQTAAAAEQFLASIDVQSQNLDTVRSAAIDWMLKLQEPAADLTLDFEAPAYGVGGLCGQDGWNWVRPAMYGKVTVSAGKVLAGGQSAMIDVEGDNLWRDVYLTVPPFVTGSRLLFKIKGENADFCFSMMNELHEGTGAGNWYGLGTAMYPANHVFQIIWTWDLVQGRVSYEALDLTDPSNVIPTTSSEVPGGGIVYGIEIRAYSRPNGSPFWVSLDDIAFLSTPVSEPSSLFALLGGMPGFAGMVVQRRMRRTPRRRASGCSVHAEGVLFHSPA